MGDPLPSTHKEERKALSRAQTPAAVASTISARTRKKAAGIAMFCARMAGSKRGSYKAIFAPPGSGGKDRVQAFSAKGGE